MKVTVFDFETYSLEPDTRITEVGAIAYEVIENKWTELERIQQFCHEPDYPEIPEHIIELTGITNKMLEIGGITRKEMFESMLIPLISRSEILVAHNAPFDKMVLMNTAQFLGLTIPERLIFDSRKDVPWDAKNTCFKLSHLAYEEDIPHDKHGLHRADKDCELVQKLLEKYGWEKCLEYAKSPETTVSCKIIPPWEDGGAQKAFISRLKFKWDNTRKVWEKKIKSAQLDILKDAVRNSGHKIELNIE